MHGEELPEGLSLPDQMAYSKISDANKKLDAKNELWHAVRIGMITAANYKTITGEDYPNIPPTRVETKAAL